MPDSDSFDVIIAGAGPAGSYLAALLSKKKLRVLVLEKKSIVGKQACSGLISTRLSDFVPITNDFLEHKISGAIFRSKNSSLRLRKKTPAAYVINRPKFDRFLLERAKKEGAEIHLCEAFESYFAESAKNAGPCSTESGCVVVNNKYRAKVLVGADGAGSLVRRKSGLSGNLVFLNGVIAIFPNSAPELSRFGGKQKTGSCGVKYAPVPEIAGGFDVEIFYGKNIAPGFFAWKIPRGNSVEYGLASNKGHLSYFRKFLKSQKRALESLGSPNAFHAHPIIYGIQQTAGERVMLLGDAAAQVKPFSGGGVIYGFICAQIALCAICEAFEKRDFSARFLAERYDSVWKKKLAPSIELGAMLRKMLDSLDDCELDEFFELAGKSKSDVELFADMDFL